MSQRTPQTRSGELFPIQSEFWKKTSEKKKEEELSGETTQWEIHPSSDSWDAI